MCSFNRVSHTSNNGNRYKINGILVSRYWVRNAKQHWKFQITRYIYFTGGVLYSDCYDNMSQWRSQPSLSGGAKWTNLPNFCLFFLIFPDFPLFFSIFSTFNPNFPLFPNFCKFFTVRGHSSPTPTGYATVQSPPAARIFLNFVLILYMILYVLIARYCATHDFFF